MSNAIEPTKEALETARELMRKAPGLQNIALAIDAFAARARLAAIEENEANVKRVARAIGEVMLPEVTMISAAMSLRVRLKISLGDSRASGVLEDIARSALRAIAVASDHITDDTPSSGG